MVKSLPKASQRVSNRARIGTRAIGLQSLNANHQKGVTSFSH